MEPIIIIGAPRSGTKMLRAMLASHPKLVTFPSEIDYIWKYGNEEFLCDELTMIHAKPKVKLFIREQFKYLSKRHSNAGVVEKSVANSLRVGFVHSIFPNARFIHLIRDGRACVESVKRSWESGFNSRYYLQKFKGVVWRDVLFFAPKYLRHHLHRKGFVGSNKGVNGPHFSGMRKLQEEKSSLEVCAIQWRKCVEKASVQLEAVPTSQVFSIKYEDLVRESQAVLGSVFEFLDLEFAKESQDYTKNNILDSNVAKWKRNLSKEELELILPHMGDQLLALGYSK